MADWIMAHPWMTVFLLALALMVVESVIANICEEVSRRKDTPLPEQPKEGKP